MQMNGTLILLYFIEMRTTLWYHPPLFEIKSLTLICQADLSVTRVKIWNTLKVRNIST